jgi:uncharacterized protein (DUF952 family)
MLLYITTKKVQAQIRYESAGGEERYPHIYGPLNLDAVAKTVEFKPAKNGNFVFPKDIADTSDVRALE